MDPKLQKAGHEIPGTFVFHCSVLSTKFKLSSFFHFGDKRGVPNLKSGSRDLDHALIRANLSFVG